MDVTVIGSTTSLSTVEGAITVNETTTDVNSETSTVVEGPSYDSKPMELYTVVELYVSVVVYDTGTVLGGRVELPVVVRSVVKTVDLVTLNVVVYSGIVTVLVRFMEDLAVVVKSLVNIDVMRDVVFSVAVGSTRKLILSSLLLCFDRNVELETSPDEVGVKVLVCLIELVPAADECPSKDEDSPADVVEIADVTVSAVPEAVPEDLEVPLEASSDVISVGLDEDPGGVVLDAVSESTVESLLSVTVTSADMTVELRPVVPIFVVSAPPDRSVGPKTPEEDGVAS